jgi:hypothetical protein
MSKDLFNALVGVKNVEGAKAMAEFTVAMGFRIEWALLILRAK